MQRTPLYESHLRLGAKMVDFGGWAMPVSYAGGIIDEHRATRQAVGVFDVCHMGEIHFRGARAAEAVQRLVTNDVGRLTDGRALYTVACLPTGGIVDDLIVYRLSATHYLTVVNAGNLEKDRAWFFEHARPLCDVTDASAETALIAFQGPGAKHALQPLTKLGLGDLASFAFVQSCEIAGVQGLDRAHRLHRRGRVRDLLRRQGRRHALGPPGRGSGGDRRQAGRARRARHAPPRGAAASLRQRSGRDDHAARGGARLGGEAGGRRLHRP